MNLITDADRCDVRSTDLLQHVPDPPVPELPLVASRGNPLLQRSVPLRRVHGQPRGLVYIFPGRARQKLGVFQQRQGSLRRLLDHRSGKYRERRYCGATIGGRIPGLLI